MVHGALRTVGVVYFDFVSFFAELIAGFAQRGGGLLGDEGHGFLVPVNARAHEVVGAVISDFQDSVGDGVGEEAETVRQRFKIGFFMDSMFFGSR